MPRFTAALLVALALVFSTTGAKVFAQEAKAREAPAAYKTITFKSADGLEITADLYMRHARSAPFVVLFHQAGWSRGEYREIAPRLLDLGFNAMAVDARSGGEVGGVRNETAARAKKAKKARGYVDALPDLRAALEHARNKHATGKVIAWGSSYSSALVLYLAGTEPDLADATLAFAPGEYFARAGKPKTWIRAAAKAIAKPVFITSARGEARNWRAIYKAIPATTKARFVPKTKGNHGSRALWAKFADSGDYWAALEAFLAGLK